MASVKRGEVFLVNFDPTVGAEAKKFGPLLGYQMMLTTLTRPLFRFLRLLQT